jgi:hypothetical protein
VVTEVETPPLSGMQARRPFHEVAADLTVGRAGAVLRSLTSWNVEPKVKE